MTTDGIARVLVVDDEPMANKLVQSQVASLRYSVAGAAFNGPEAVELARRLRPDVVMMDLQMLDPETGQSDPEAGLSAAQVIQEQCPTAVILLTAHESPELVRRASAAGVGAYLVKPARVSDLERAIIIARARFDDMVALSHLNADLETEIADRMRAEESLRRSETKYRTLFNYIADPVFIYDQENLQILDCNQTVLDRYGYTLDELRRMTPDQLQPRDEGEGGQEDVSHRGDAWPHYYTHVTKDKDRFPVEIHRAEFEYEGRKAWLSVARDITERVRAEEAMLEASRLEATATLAGGIAHDFNNLMTGVLGNAELLEMELTGAAGVSGHPNPVDMLGVISESARKASRLAQQLLAYAQGGKYQPRAMNLNGIVGEVVRLWREEMTLPAGVQIVCRADPSLRDVEADATQMSEVVLNLLTNAVEAVENGGSITVTTRNIDVGAVAIADLDPGPYVCLSVRDTGRGMSARVRDRAFEPFFTTKFQGRGMGLAAAYGIVRNHGGQILVRSEEGQGATFEVYLPALRADAGTAETPSMPEIVAEAFEGVPTVVAERTPVASPRTILIIEDDELVSRLALRMVTRFGHCPLVARDGLEAVKIARTYDGEIHLALLDMGLPIMSGEEAYPLLMEARPGLKVIIYSGYRLDASAQALLDAGASTFIQKPFRMHVLEQAIRQALG